MTGEGAAGSVAVVQGSTAAGLSAASDGDVARAIALARPGEAHDAESELYRRFARRVRLYGVKHLRDDAAAEDLAQQVLLLTIEKLRAGEVRNPDEVGSFILGASRMQASAAGRKARRRDDLMARFEMPHLLVEPEPGFDLDAVERCLHALTERDRQVLVLSFYDERTSAEIGNTLGMTAPTVRVARHRALGRLRECVQGGATSR